MSYLPDGRKARAWLTARRTWLSHATSGCDTENVNRSTASRPESLSDIPGVHMIKLRVAFMIAALAGACVAGSASAQSTLGWGGGSQLLDEYSAYIGHQDLHASDGVRLTAAWQVIRQDRANYHRYGRRDRGDQGDTFFNSVENRAIMEQMVRDGVMSPSAARAIVAGDVWITVRIFGRGSRGQRIEVTVN